MLEDGTPLPADVLCPICCDIFLDPTTLPCGHTFCQGCLADSAAHAARSRTAPRCGTCREPLPKRRPGEGAINFQFRDLLQRCYTEAERARRAEAQPAAPPAEATNSCKPYMPRAWPPLTDEQQRAKVRFSKQLRSQRTMRKLARDGDVGDADAKLPKYDARIAEILQQVWQLHAAASAQHEVPGR